MTNSGAGSGRRDGNELGMKHNEAKEIKMDMDSQGF